LALFHLHVTQVKRSAGQSVVTSAAYRAGEKLYSEYYGEVSDYTHKGGVVCTDILLPPQAPNQYQDRATLWNAVEKAEHGKKAQLAYSFDIALQNEFSLRKTSLLQGNLFRSSLWAGMIADFAIHQPDKEDGGIPNPHFHVLCPIRPIEPDGKWGCKQRRRYRLDEDGNRIMGEDGKPLFDAVPKSWRCGSMLRRSGPHSSRSAGRQGSGPGACSILLLWPCLNELKELLRLVDLYRDTKPVYDELQGIKWKGKREKFEREHENELRTFHMARRKLDKHRSPAGKIPVHAWEQEQARLHQEYTAEYEQYKPIQDDLRRLQQVKRNADAAIHQQEQTQQKRREVER